MKLKMVLSVFNMIDCGFGFTEGDSSDFGKKRDLTGGHHVDNFLENVSEFFGFINVSLKNVDST